MLKLLPENLPPQFSFDTKELGVLFCFPLRVKDIEVLDNIRIPVKNEQAWVRALVSVACHSENSLKEGEFKPDEFDLAGEHVVKLSDKELEDFAEKYVDNNPHLWPEGSVKEERKPIPNEGENNINFLYRLDQERNAREVAKFEKMLGSDTISALRNTMGSASIFSNETMGKIAGLKSEQAKLFSNFDIGHTRPPFPDIPKPMISSGDRTVRRLDALIQISKTSTEVQESLAVDIGNAIATSDKRAKLNILISWAILGLSVISLGWAIWNNYENNKQMRELIINFHHNSTAIEHTLTELVQSNKLSHEDAKLLTNAILSLDSKVDRKDQSAKHLE